MLMVVTCLVISAKVEERERVSINRLISVLDKEKKLYITKAKVIETERTLLSQFDFDILMVTSYHFLARFLHLTRFD